MSKTSELVREIASQATSNYLNNGVPLKNTVVKLAKDRDLSPDVVRRVIEQANKETQVALYAKHGAEDVFEFPIAKAADVLKELNQDIEEAISNSDSKLSSAPSHLKFASIEDEDSDWNPMNMTREQALLMLNEKLSVAKQKMNEILKEAEASLLGATDKFIEMCRQGFVSGDFSPMDAVFTVSTHRPDSVKLAAKLINEAADKSHIDGLSDELIKQSEHLPSSFLVNSDEHRAQDIGGKSAIVLSIDTIREWACQVLNSHTGLQLIEDRSYQVAKGIQDNLAKEYSKDM